MYMNYKYEGVATLFGTWIEWLMKEMKNLVDTRFSALPVKAKNSDSPFYYWVAVPTHSCFSRE